MAWHINWRSSPEHAHLRSPLELRANRRTGHRRRQVLLHRRCHTIRRCSPTLARSCPSMCSSPPNHRAGPASIRSRCRPSSGTGYPAPKHPLLTGKKLLVMSHTRGEIPENECHLLLQVPYPDKVVPLLSEPIRIHRGKALVSGLNQDSPNIVDGPRARGLRFIYRKCSKEPEVELFNKPDTTTGVGLNMPPPSEPDFSRFSARTLGYDEHYSITIRFASNQVTPDYHQDAYCCFRKMRDLISDTHCWPIDFDDPRVGKIPPLENISGPHPKDCRASILVVQDAG